MMAEYIEREMVLDTIGVRNNRVWNDVYDLPIADVVSVTRCKDCVHSFFDSHHNCRWCRRNWGRILVEDNDFCSYGKQEEDNKEAEEKFLSTLSPEARKLYFKLIRGDL